MYRLKRVLCVLLINVLALAACTLSALSAPITIVHITGIHGQPFYEFLLERAAAFEKLYPGVHVEIQNHPSGYADKLLAMIGAGTQIDTIDSTPTVLLKNDKDYFLDMNPYLRADNIDLYRLIPSMAKRVLESDGRLLALPNQLYAVVAGYNRSLFDELGIAPLSGLGDDWNWDWIRANAPRLNIDVNGDGNLETVAIGFSHGFERVDAAVNQAGGSFFEKDLNPRQALFDTPQVRQGLSFYIELVERGWAQIGRYSLTNRSVAISLHITGAEATPLRTTTDVWEAVVKPKGPVRRGGPFYVGPMRVMKNTKHPEWAVRWLAFIELDGESQADMLRKTGRIPLHLPTLARIDTLLAHEPPVIRNFWKQLINASLDEDNYPALISPIKNDIVRLFDSQFPQVLRGTLPLENFIANMQRQVQAMLDELHATP
jgi:ABC-type glycerol-3-phosphate transport system substrate-binding protein